MTPLPYCNNLRKDDVVEVASTLRRGVVATGPREQSRTVAVLLHGTNTPRYLDVLDLRLVVDGKSEEVPPIDGDPRA